jgi:adenylate cyclase
MRNRFWPWLSRSTLPWRGAVGLGLWLGVACAAFGYWREGQVERVSFIDDLEEALFGAKFAARGLVRPGGDVVIAAIDERSMDRFGRWPWPREVFAQLVRRLDQYGARVVAFDVIFDKPERRPWRDEARAMLESLRKAPAPREEPKWLRALATQDPDRQFADAVRASPGTILGFFLFEKEVDRRGVTDDELALAQVLVRHARIAFKLGNGVPHTSAEALFNRAQGLRAPIPILAQAARRRLAYFTTHSDAEGKSVGLPLVTAVRGDFFCHLSLLAASRFLEEEPVAELASLHHPPRIALGEHVVPSELYGRFYPNFYGPRNTFKHFSVADIIDGVVPRARLSGKIVFVGASAIGLYDQRRTPFDQSMPGVEIHATAADNILTRRYLARPPELFLGELIALFALGPLVGFVVGRRSRLVGVLLALGVLAALAVTDVLAFREGLLVRSAVLYLEIIVVALASYGLLYFLVFKERKRLRNTMQHYLAPSVLDEMLRDQSKLRLGGEKRELTVLFSDIRSFTTLSESFDAPELVAFLNEYFSPMTDIVLAHLGTFDKYIGDALMAYFGAPQVQPDHAARACRACLDMRDRLGELNAKWHARGLPTISIGLGLSTGPSAFGNMGSTRLFNYTVIGDNVNIASRVEGASKIFGVTIAVAESTARAAGAEFVFRRLGATFVAGKGDAQTLYELVDRAERRAMLAPWLEAYEAGVSAWDARDLDGAEAAFRQALARNAADATSTKYLARIEEARARGTWDVTWKAAK